MGKNMTINIKKLGLLLIIFIISFTFSGCWNYREVEDTWIVAGTAIDWDKQAKKYIITAEVLKPKGGKETQMISNVISLKGDTLFDAMRNGVAISGKKLYWAHAQILVISNSIARQGMIPILDLLNRGGEFRSNIDLAVSKENTAKEILETKMNLYDAISFQLGETFKAQEHSSTYMDSEAWYFQQDFFNEGISSVLSTVKIVKTNNETVPQIDGAAVFKKDKLIGYIDGIDTKSLLFVRNNLKGGAIAVKNVANTNVNVSLEILENKTTITPQIENGNITMDINVKTSVGITEIEGVEDFLSDEGRMKLKTAANATIKKQIEKLIKKTQDNFDSDILGFGKKIQKKMPSTWKKLEPNWDEIFKEVKTNINVDVSITSSSGSYMPIPVGD
jgi:spore germination protein KC